MEFMIPPFEEMYGKLREKEGRIYTDTQLKKIPDLDPQHPYFKEWRTRKYSCQRILAYLKKKNKPLKILEVGCGNGWLSNQLSKISNTEVLGVDPHRLEIDQAQRVFLNPNLNFRYGNLDTILSWGLGFDIIVYAASIQYFPSLPDSVQKSLEILSAGGEILLIDSPLYSKTELIKARRRTELYYSNLGFPEMSRYYFHHGMDDLNDFAPKILYNPISTWNRIRQKSPFFIISIQRKGIQEIR